MPNRRPKTRAVAEVAFIIVLAGACTTQSGSNVVARGSDSSTVVTTEPGDAETAPRSSTDPPAPASLIDGLAAVPLDAIVAAHGKSRSANPVSPITGPALIESGKPQVLYIGAEFCPYCAAERWALAVALTKFGTFSGVKLIESSEGDVPTLSFEGSTYTSDQVAFTPVELQDQNHESLGHLSATQQALFEHLGNGSFPFIDFGGRFMQSGGSVDMNNLIGKRQADIARTLAKSTPGDDDPSSLQGNVNAVAGEFIDKICALTGGNPHQVCSAFTGS